MLPIVQSNEILSIMYIQNVKHRFYTMKSDFVLRERMTSDLIIVETLNLVGTFWAMYVVFLYRLLCVPALTSCCYS
jgi:hypothetical protein